MQVILTGEYNPQTKTFKRTQVDYDGMYGLKIITDDGTVYRIREVNHGKNLNISIDGIFIISPYSTNVIVLSGKNTNE